MQPNYKSVLPLGLEDELGEAEVLTFFHFAQGCRYRQTSSSLLWLLNRREPLKHSWLKHVYWFWIPVSLPIGLRPHILILWVNRTQPPASWASVIVKSAGVAR